MYFVHAFTRIVDGFASLFSICTTRAQQKSNNLGKLTSISIHFIQVFVESVTYKDVGNTDNRLERFQYKNPLGVVWLSLTGN